MCLFEIAWIQQLQYEDLTAFGDLLLATACRNTKVFNPEVCGSCSFCDVRELSVMCCFCGLLSSFFHVFCCLKYGYPTDGTNTKSTKKYQEFQGPGCKLKVFVQWEYTVSNLKVIPKYQCRIFHPFPSSCSSNLQVLKQQTHYSPLLRQFDQACLHYLN